MCIGIRVWVGYCSCCIHLYKRSSFLHTNESVPYPPLTAIMNAIAYGLFVICLAIHTFISLSLPCERENDTSPIVKIHVKLPASKQPIPIRIKSLEFGNQMLRSLFLNHSAAFSVYMLFCYMCFCLHVFLFTWFFFRFTCFSIHLFFCSYAFLFTSCFFFLFT